MESQRNINRNTADIRPARKSEAYTFPENEYVGFDVVSAEESPKQWEDTFDGVVDVDTSLEASAQECPIEDLNFRESEGYIDKISPQKVSVDLDIDGIGAMVRRWLFDPVGRKVFAALFVMAMIGGGGMLLRIGVGFKGEVLGESEVGYAHLSSAVDSLKAQDFAKSGQSFSDAYASSGAASKSLGMIGTFFAETVGNIPGLSVTSSGVAAIDAGKHLSAAGIVLNTLATSFGVENISSRDTGSLLDHIASIGMALRTAEPELSMAVEALAKINKNDLPIAKQAEFLSSREKVTKVRDTIAGLLRNEALVYDLLGGNGPRKYLFLLQNNSELRATGGFIGSYALLEIQDGSIRRFFVDGIFNPDGQLKENIVPPMPIQKISAGWSLHDSNWWPDFPTSARKAELFYEKTGGATVDGVIAFTPVMLQKILALVGPIELSEYGVTVDAENFLPIIQEQVEEKYDRIENRPKKILGDLSEKIFEKMLAEKHPAQFALIVEALVAGLNERQAILFANNENIEEMIVAAGWSGRLLPTEGDYVSVVHSNINGYKTDSVIDDHIRHRVEIQSDGSIVDTLSITRKHTGGNTPYEWWNKVNANYMRVYVPLGSKLLSAKGATYEFPKPPLDYDALGFHRDMDVVHDEKEIFIDEDSGTRIGEENGKTVFGNWVYVSPGESVTVEYRYLLPFLMDMAAVRTGDVRSFSVLYQKQAGTLGSGLVSRIELPESVNLVWQSEGNLIPYKRTLEFDTDLSVDRFFGVVIGEDEEQ